jgi:hypothetical protein
MKTVFVILALAGAISLVDIPGQQLTGSSEAIAQARSSACYQNCRHVRDWPSAQCRQYCRGRAKR